MAFLELRSITKQFGRTVAVDQVSLAIEQGEFLTLLGPSGCGKTTLLRMMAGFEHPDEGTILLDGVDITRQAANKRPMGMVFQSYALFPHMTVEQNIAFGMRIQRRSQEYIKQRGAELLEMVGLPEVGSRYPHQLSGGQQQRIALARALAIEPKVLLLDEPLSALDARVRVTLRNEIRRIQQRLKMTAVYVTHDQEEALSISDRIAVLAQGRVEQLDQPEQIYSAPQTAFAATFVGTSNQFRGTITSAASGSVEAGPYTLHVPTPLNYQDGTAVLVVVRPEEISVQALESGEEQNLKDVANILSGRVELRTFLGPFTRLQVRIDNATLLTIDIISQQDQGYTLDQPVQLTFPAQACKVLPLNPKEATHIQKVMVETV